MSEIGDTTQNPKMARIQGFLTSRRGVLRDYFTAISGSAGRLVFSLAYFVALANTLSIIALMPSLASISGARIIFWTSIIVKVRIGMAVRSTNRMMIA